jgi:radical SAM superfamily enzyme YgiQ (UPF0313 family)
MPGDAKSRGAAVCLVRPPAVETFRFATTSITLPLGLAYIAAALEEAGHEVCVIDALASAPQTTRRYFKGYLIGLPLEEVVGRVPDVTQLVGISVIFTHEWPAAVRLIELLKRGRPDVRVVLGGEHVTSMPEFCLRTSKADYLVLGEGEETIVELVEAVDGDADVSGIAGLAYRDSGGIVVNPRRARRRDVDTIAPPAWHHIDIATYNENRWVGGMYDAGVTLPILATRGCPYQCTYCSSPNMWTPRWIPRDPKNVVDEIQGYIERYGATHFPFQDLTAIVQKKWIVEFCRELLARGLDIHWQLPSGTRSEAIDEEVAQLLRETNMISTSYAPESGSDETRKLIKKQMRSDRLFASMRAAVKADLNLTCFLVIGFPHDNPANLAENLPFIDAMAETGISDCSVGFYMALPGTELFYSLYDAGKIHIDRAYFRHILSSLQLVSTQTYCDDLSRVQLTYWKFRLLSRFYSRRKKRKSEGGLVASLRRAASGLSSDSRHTSKLESVFRNAVDSLWLTLATKLRPGWMPRAEERALFEGWEQIYADIRRRNLAEGVAQRAPGDSRDLHAANVIPILRRNHGRRHHVPA